MKTRLYSPFLFLTGLVLLVGLACVTSAAVQPTNPPQAATLAIPPTQTHPPITDTPAPHFLTETFLGDLSQWTYYITAGDESKYTASQTDNGLRIQLDDPNLYVYYFYDPYTYQDVRLDLTFKNLAHNSNNINLVCRGTDDGRYEFTVQNDGLYQIWAYDHVGGSGYVMLASGGSLAIRSGKQDNDITTTCIGNTLTLYINGTMTKSVTDNRFFFDHGQIGFGLNISPSNPVTPVVVEFESLAISQP